jgi:hypothetical protein
MLEIEHRTEPPRVMETDDDTAAEDKINVVVLAHLHRGVANSHAAGHAKVNHQMTTIQPDQQVLGSPADRYDRLSGHRLG